MSTLNIQLPASLRQHLEELARQEGVSVEQFITVAVAEKVSALRTVDYLEERAARASREAFERVLAKVPNVEPPEYDRL